MGWRLCPLSALVKSSRWPENDSQRYQTLTAVIKPFLMETIGEKLLKSISIHVRSNTNSNDGCQGTSFSWPRHPRAAHEPLFRAVSLITPSNARRLTNSIHQRRLAFLPIGDPSLDDDDHFPSALFGCLFISIPSFFASFLWPRLTILII